MGEGHMRNFLIILAAFVGLTAFGATNEPSIQMLATTNGVVKLPTNITSIRIGGTVFTNLLGFGLAVSNNQLSIDTTQLPAGGGGGGSGTVTSVGASTTVSGLGFSGSPVTSSGTLSLTGVVAVASGGTGASDASGARTALSLVPGTNVQAWDADLDDLADGSLTGSKVGSGIDDDNVSFDDADSLWTATTIGAALEELNDSINAGVPNGTGAKLHWSQLLGVPAGFADGSDDGSGGGSGTMTGISFVVPGPFSISPTSTTTTNTFTLSVSNQTANTVWAGPTSGGAAAPTFRALVDDDVPNTITVDLATTATTANAGDSATAFFSSGTIEEARIDSTIARDSEVTAATAEATLESVLDLQDLQGAVTDAQVPNTITIDQATLALTGDSATSFFSTGEIEDARLPSGLTRDAEAAATYAPLASPALTGSPTVPTASAGVSNTLAASTAYVDRAVASGGGGETNTASNLGTPSSTVQGLYNSKSGVDLRFRSIEAGSNITLSSNANTVAISAVDVSWNGSAVGSGTVTNLTTASVAFNGFTRTNWHTPLQQYAPLICEFIGGSGIAVADMGYPVWKGIALSSGTSTVDSSSSNRLGVVELRSSSSANSGYEYLSDVTQLYAQPGLTFECLTTTRETNAGTRVFIGFFDSTTISTPTDGIYLYRSNNFIIPRIVVNSVFTDGYEYAVGGTVRLRNSVSVIATNQVRFIVENSDSGATILSTNITSSLPDTSARAFGCGLQAYHTNTVSTQLEKIDKFMLIPINAEIVR